MPKKKKSTGRKWPYSSDRLREGEIMWVKNHFYFSCCDCGLRHHVVVDKQATFKGEKVLKPNDKWLALHCYRDDRITALERRQDKIKVLVKGKPLEE